MCGRYVLYSSMVAIRDLFGLDPLPEDDAGWLSPRYNIAPTQMVAIIRALRSPSERELALVRWGLVPSWAKAISGGPLNINARSETVADKPSFRSAYKRRRCLVPADGFYEWQKRGKEKLPHYFRQRQDRPLALAGIWERWGEGEERLESCAIITTSANALVTPVHHRMPVIIADGARDLWLDPASDAEAVGRLLRPAPADLLTVQPVGRAVNRTQSQGPELIAPASPEDDGGPTEPPASDGQLSLL